ncbi:hypothetical protein PLICRDRAFT_642780 [Plicaturopsis crispa FD-325 SS-3]|nr:hypothetical protein PLICRDRAFT_642780 [Plicaturopsis crispa FD-325 SS-3]
MEAPPPFLVIIFLPPLLPFLCLHDRDVMTLPLHYWPVSSGDLPSFLCGTAYSHQSMWSRCAANKGVDFHVHCADSDTAVFIVVMF